MVMGDIRLDIALPESTIKVVMEMIEMQAPLIVPSAYWLGVFP